MFMGAFRGGGQSRGGSLAAPLAAGKAALPSRGREGGREDAGMLPGGGREGGAGRAARRSGGGAQQIWGIWSRDPAALAPPPGKLF